MASVIWGQDSERNDWSWPRARDYFFDGLTSASPGDREKALAKTFRSLGQVMHLIVDLAVPAHTRNDAHPLSYTLESWLPAVSALDPGRFTEFLQPTIDPDPSLLSLSPNSEAPIPIARLWDADQFTGENPEITAGTGAGLAEYTNANFLSEDTRFTGYLFPSRESVRAEDFIIPDPREPSGTSTRQYHVKWQHGDTGYRLATVGFLRDYYSRYLPGRLGEVSEGLDDHVYSDYSRRLLPRAVGYARALLNYFFRERLQPSFVPGPDGGKQVILRTLRLGNEPIGRGILSLLYDDSDGTRRRIREIKVPDLGRASELPEIQFDIPAEPPSQYVVVYRGRLGLEEDAVVGRVFGGVPIVAVQELAALTGAKSERLNPFLGSGGGRELRKDPNQQRAAGYFWAGGTVGVGKKIREVRLEEGTEGGAFLGRFPPKAVLRINRKDVGTHWQPADDPSLIPELWEVVLTPIPGQTSEIGVVPPSAIWVNDFRTPLLWVNSVESATGQFTFLGQDGVPVWITTKTQFTIFHFGDGVRGSDPKSGTPLTPEHTGVSFRPVGEAAGGRVPRAELAFLPESCGTNGPLYRFAFAFASRSLNFLIFPSACGVVSPAGWAKHLLWLQERVLTLGAQPDPAPPPLLTVATFRREFLEADLERFLSVGIVPPEYDIQTQ